MKEIIILCFCSGHLDKLFSMVFCVSLCLLEKIYHVLMPLIVLKICYSRKHDIDANDDEREQD